MDKFSKGATHVPRHLTYKDSELIKVDDSLRFKPKSMINFGRSWPIISATSDDKDTNSSPEIRAQGVFTKARTIHVF